MIRIKPKDKFNITGRGDVFAVDVRDQDQDTLIQLAQYGLDKLREDNIKINIDNEVYTIHGIERFGVTNSDYRAGLLVKKVYSEQV